LHGNVLCLLIVLSLCKYKFAIILILLSMTTMSANWMVQDHVVMALKTEAAHQLGLAPSDEDQEAAPRTAAVYLASGDQMTPRADGTVIQGVPDRSARKSSFRVCKPQATFLWPSMASGTTISGGVSSSCPAAATPGPGIRHGTSCPSSAGPGLPRSSRAPAVEVEAASAWAGRDEHLMLGALFSTPPSASSTNAAAAAAKLQLSLPSPRSPLQPQKLFGTAAAAAAGFSPQKLLHFSGLTRLRVVSPLACTASSASYSAFRIIFL